MPAVSKEKRQAEVSTFFFRKKRTHREMLTCKRKAEMDICMWPTKKQKGVAKEAERVSFEQGAVGRVGGGKWSGWSSVADVEQV